MGPGMSSVETIGVGCWVWNEADEYFGCQIDEIYILMSNLIQNLPFNQINLT